MPTRRGTTGVALAAAGLEAVVDLRGKEDLFGNILRVTSQAIADDLCSAAQLIMGESDEATPFVLVRGVKDSLIGKAKYPAQSFAVRADQCVYMRSLGYSAKRTFPRAS
jgi:F420-0:gamma-glutamyl ligase